MQPAEKHQLFSGLTLPCGLNLKNRIAKAAMEENMAVSGQLPGEDLFRLYQAWAKGGAGMIITGNVMVDHLAMTGPGGVALEADTSLQPFEQWAKLSKQNDCKIIMQINHPGRQVFKKMGGKVLSPSDVALDMGAHSGLFTQPKAMTDEEIEDVIERFVTTAKRAEAAGFDGVEVHAAHGYLLAQFLSPLTNKRQDQWGGSIDNRSRLLLEIIKRIRQAVSPQFALSVKLNSADFQRGGFDVDDAKKVVEKLSEEAVDFIELSGGSYEAPAMQGRTADGRTLEREAYFLSFAEQIAAVSKVPVMTTGGIRRLPVAEKVVANNVALVGIASALAYNPDLPNRWQQDARFEGVIPLVNWKDKTLAGLATMAMVKRQLRRIGAGKTSKQNISPLVSLIADQLRAAKLTKRYRKQYANEVS
ncbi:NADH:flavin oxidoreductase/NADH oxidase family protein [Planctobacterium marinum]|uniref:2,4-dienoyl-CoA reductase n=1 Tax=Planctobacterium marinum TaxID=1631968 RepID=A0AA48HUA8_9ALTE|nr:2,4-dienoyl-CoA reductase [Planctobacterium marinum]